VIDDWNTNRKLGLLFEAKIGEGKLLVCSMDLRSELEQRPVARQMLHSLLSYMKSRAFAPKHTLDAELIHSLLKTPSLLSNARVVKTDSEAPGHEAGNAIDGNPKTIWHTTWGENAPAYPHEIQIELPGNHEIRGFTYLPRQDMSNGWINQYEFYVSDGSQNWGEPVSTGRFERNRNPKKILFGEAKYGRFFRFVALSGFDGQAFASVAEIDLITE
jgi:hypothetical protein